MNIIFDLRKRTHAVWAVHSHATSFADGNLYSISWEDACARHYPFLKHQLVALYLIKNGIATAEDLHKWGIPTLSYFRRTPE